MIQPTHVFKDNLAQLPAIDGIERIDLVDGQGAVVADIENKPGKQGSVAVYHYLQQTFGQLDAKAAEHGLAVFAEHTIDARSRCESFGSRTPLTPTLSRTGEETRVPF